MAARGPSGEGPRLPRGRSGGSGGSGCVPPGTVPPATGTPAASASTASPRSSPGRSSRPSSPPPRRFAVPPPSHPPLLPVPPFLPSSCPIGLPRLSFLPHLLFLPFPPPSPIEVISDEHGILLPAASLAPVPVQHRSALGLVQPSPGRSSFGAAWDVFRRGAWPHPLRLRLLSGLYRGSLRASRGPRVGAPWTLSWGPFKVLPGRPFGGLRVRKSRVR